MEESTTSTTSTPIQTTSQSDSTTKRNENQCEHVQKAICSNDIDTLCSLLGISSSDDKKQANVFPEHVEIALESLLSSSTPYFFTMFGKDIKTKTTRIKRVFSWLLNHLKTHTFTTPQCSDMYRVLEYGLQKHGIAFHIPHIVLSCCCARQRNIPIEITLKMVHSIINGIDDLDIQLAEYIFRHSSSRTNNALFSFDEQAKNLLEQIVHGDYVTCHLSRLFVQIHLKKTTLFAISHVLTVDDNASFIKLWACFPNLPCTMFDMLYTSNADVMINYHQGTYSHKAHLFMVGNPVYDFDHAPMFAKLLLCSPPALLPVHVKKQITLGIIDHGCLRVLDVWLAYLESLTVKTVKLNNEFSTSMDIPFFLESICGDKVVTIPPSMFALISIRYLMVLKTTGVISKTFYDVFDDCTDDCATVSASQRRQRCNAPIPSLMGCSASSSLVSKKMSRLYHYICRQLWSCTPPSYGYKILQECLYKLAFFQALFKSTRTDYATFANTFAPLMTVAFANDSNDSNNNYQYKYKPEPNFAYSYNEETLALRHNLLAAVHDDSIQQLKSTLILLDVALQNANMSRKDSNSNTFREQSFDFYSCEDMLRDAITMCALLGSHEYLKILAPFCFRHSIKVFTHRNHTMDIQSRGILSMYFGTDEEINLYCFQLSEKRNVLLKVFCF